MEQALIIFGFSTLIEDFLEDLLGAWLFFA